MKKQYKIILGVAVGIGLLGASFADKEELLRSGLSKPTTAASKSRIELRKWSPDKFSKPNVDASKSQAEPPKWLPKEFSQWNYKENRFMTNEEKGQLYWELSEKMEKVADTYVLGFIFSADCEHSRKMAAELKRFEEAHRGWPVVGFSVDGTHLDEFPTATKDPGLAKMLKLDGLPALVAIRIDKKGDEKSKVVLLAYGITSHVEIMEKLSAL